MVVFTVATVPQLSTPLENATATDRTLWAFRKMLNARTTRWCSGSLYWDGYGCWCGKGDDGTNSMDEFDEACRCHDECWGMHRNAGEICHGASQGHWLWYDYDIADNGEVSN